MSDVTQLSDAELIRLLNQANGVEPIEDAVKRINADPTTGMSTIDKLRAGAGKAFSDTAMGVGQLLGVVPQTDVDEAAARDAPLMRTGAGRAGAVIGAGAETLPMMFVPGANTIPGAALSGAIMGGIQPVASGDDRGKNVIYGGAAGAAGQMGANVLGRLLRPVRSEMGPEAQRLAQVLQQEGVPLDLADLTQSRPLQGIRGVLRTMPSTAARQQEVDLAKQTALNRAVLSRVGENADAATPDVMRSARDRIGQQFSDLSQRNFVKLDTNFVDDVAKVDTANRLRGPYKVDLIETEINKALDLAGQGKLEGKAYQEIRSTLGKRANDAFKSGNSVVGQAIKDLKAALDSAAERSIAPEDTAAWKEARAQWDALKVIEPAVAPTSIAKAQGHVSAAQLASSLASKKPQQAIYGGRPDGLDELARSARVFNVDPIANSGTPERTFWQNMLTDPLSTLSTAVASAGPARLFQRAINAPMNQSTTPVGRMADQMLTRYGSRGIVPITAQQQALINALGRGVGAGGAFVRARPLPESAQ